MSLWFDDLANAKEESYFRARDRELIEAMRARDLSQVSAPKSEDFRAAHANKEQKQPKS